MTQPAAPVRTPLLTAQFPQIKPTDRVEVVRVEMPPGQKAPLHIHVPPVVGYIVSGRIRFQLEGQAEVVLKAGDAFFEPAMARVSAFDNASATESATFIAYYLLGKDDREMITFVK